LNDVPEETTNIPLPLKVEENSQTVEYDNDMTGEELNKRYREMMKKHEEREATLAKLTSNETRPTFNNTEIKTKEERELLATLKGLLPPIGRKLITQTIKDKLLKGVLDILI